MGKTKELFAIELSWFTKSGEGCYTKCEQHKRTLLVASLPQAIEIANRVVDKGYDYTLTFESKDNTKVCYGKKED